VRVVAPDVPPALVAVVQDVLRAQVVVLVQDVLRVQAAALVPDVPPAPVAVPVPDVLRVQAEAPVQVVVLVPVALRVQVVARAPLVQVAEPAPDAPQVSARAWLAVWALPVRLPDAGGRLGAPPAVPAVAAPLRGEEQRRPAHSPPAVNSGQARPDARAARSAQSAATALPAPGGQPGRDMPS
jgi:hypothetical protein